MRANKHYLLALALYSSLDHRLPINFNDSLSIQGHRKTVLFAMHTNER